MRTGPAGTTEPTRERVRSTIGQVGGYWRPLAALARLQEELGELAELLETDRVSEAGRSASELADLWIITTALADQFLGAVAEPDSRTLGRPADDTDPAPRGAEAPPRDLLAPLVTAAGRIARVVNYYDGPKTPRTFEGWISLEEAVAGFHRALADAARAHDVDLAKAVDAKLDAIPALDSGRFGEAEHDPSTAESLERFRAQASGSGAERLHLWGSPECSTDHAPSARAIATDLNSFTKAALWEGLDGYLICGPPFGSKAPLEQWLTRLLSDLAESDPAGGEPAIDPLDGAEPSRALEGLRPSAEPYLVFNGLRLLVSILDAPSSAGTFALLQARHPVDRAPAQ